jgi:hypothetical protein
MEQGLFARCRSGFEQFLFDSILVLSINRLIDMSDFNLSEIQPYIFILIGLTLLLIAIFKKSSNARLKKSGLKAEGVIYAKGGASKSNSDESLNIQDKITVRFLTNNDEWITADVNQDFASFFTAQYKEGEPVNIYYDPKNPSNFFVDTKQSEPGGKILFIIGGLIFCGVGIFQFFVNT